MRCPDCGLINPRRAVLCDCGCVLAGDVDSDTLQRAREANAVVAADRLERERENASADDKLGAGLSILRVLLRILGR